MSAEHVEADACGAIGCTTDEDLVEVEVGALTRVVCEFHAEALTEGER